MVTHTHDHDHEPHGHDHDHGHGHGGHGHHHGHGHHGHVHAEPGDWRYGVSIGLNLAIVLIEAVAGFFANSTALVADAGHNLSDVLGLVLAGVAVWLARRPAKGRRTYGFGKAPVLAAMANGVVLLLVSGGIVIEAVRRLFHPEPVQTGIVMIVALIGVVANSATALMFVGGKRSDVNVRGVFLHMASDALVSVGVIVAAGLIFLTGWTWLDPAVRLAIVNDVLDFSKLEDGSLELDPEPFDPRKLVTDTAALLADQAERKGIELDVQVDPALPPYLMGDTGRLRQILLNLMSNAVKFTAKGSVAVRVLATDDGARFSVSDTGIGIPEMAVGQLFQRFVQADGSISRKFGGTGLGLAISKRFVEMMGGEIGVQSSLGQGSTFWFEVPLAHASQAAPDLAPVDLEQASGVRVLLVEDAEANQELVTTILRAIGIDVDVAVNGAEAVEAVQVKAYDLVLMDVHMPVLGGVEATRLIRDHGGRLAALPIIALSANVLPEQVDEYRKAGMNAHLGKPINPGEMLAAINFWASSSRQTEAEDEVREAG